MIYGNRKKEIKLTNTGGECREPQLQRLQRGICAPCSRVHSCVLICRCVPAFQCDSHRAWMFTTDGLRIKDFVHSFPTKKINKYGPSSPQTCVSQYVHGRYSGRGCHEGGSGERKGVSMCLSRLSDSNLVDCSTAESCGVKSGWRGGIQLSHTGTMTSNAAQKQTNKIWFHGTKQSYDSSTSARHCIQLPATMQ